VSFTRENDAAGTPPKVTALTLVKPDPATVTEVAPEAGPEVGLRPVTVGGTGGPEGGTAANDIRNVESCAGSIGVVVEGKTITVPPSCTFTSPLISRSMLRIVVAGPLAD